MARIFFMMLPEKGHINSSLKVAKALKARGHDVVYSALADLEDYVRAQGLGFAPLFGGLFPKGGDVHRDYSVSIFEGLLMRLTRVAEERGTTSFELLRAELDSLFGPPGPRALVLDSYLAKSLVLALRPGDPPCVLLNSTVIDPYDNPTFNAVSRMTTLFLCPEEFDLPSLEKPPQYRHVEASCDLLREERAEFPWGRVNGEKRMVFCSLGTQAHWSHVGTDHEANQRKLKNFLQSVVNAMAERPECQLVMALGKQLRAEDFENVPADALLVGEVPQLAVLRRTWLAITHGGLNTVKECIFFGVPMLVFPLRGDQFGNAARVMFHRLGLASNIEKAPAGSVGGLVGQVARDGAFWDRVGRMRDVFVAREAEGRAVSLVEACVEGRLPTPPPWVRRLKPVPAEWAAAALKS